MQFRSFRFLEIGFFWLLMVMKDILNFLLTSCTHNNTTVLKKKTRPTLFLFLLISYVLQGSFNLAAFADSNYTANCDAKFFEPPTLVGREGDNDAPSYITVLVKAPDLNLSAAQEIAKTMRLSVNGSLLVLKGSPRLHRTNANDSFMVSLPFYWRADIFEEGANTLVAEVECSPGRMGKATHSLLADAQDPQLALISVGKLEATDSSGIKSVVAFLESSIDDKKQRVSLTKGTDGIYTLPEFIESFDALTITATDKAHNYTQIGLLKGRTIAYEHKEYGRALKQLRERSSFWQKKERQEREEHSQTLAAIRRHWEQQQTTQTSNLSSQAALTIGPDECKIRVAINAFYYCQGQPENSPLCLLNRDRAEEKLAMWKVQVYKAIHDIFNPQLAAAELRAFQLVMLQADQKIQRIEDLPLENQQKFQIVPQQTDNPDDAVQFVLLREEDFKDANGWILHPESNTLNILGIDRLTNSSLAGLAHRTEPYLALINERVSPFPGPNQDVAILEVTTQAAAHEIGHKLGLGHIIDDDNLLMKYGLGGSKLNVTQLLATLAHLCGPIATSNHQVTFGDKWRGENLNPGFEFTRPNGWIGGGRNNNPSIIEECEHYFMGEHGNCLRKNPNGDLPEVDYTRQCVVETRTCEYIVPDQPMDEPIIIDPSVTAIDTTDFLDFLNQCENQVAPACNGECPEGKTCSDEAGKCKCIDKVKSCALSEAPACGGECPPGQSCSQSPSGACACGSASCGEADQCRSDGDCPLMGGPVPIPTDPNSNSPKYGCAMYKGKCKDCRCVYPIIPVPAGEETTCSNGETGVDAFISRGFLQN
jgi:hypothetical protein